jgi:hypothetical protein
MRGRTLARGLGWASLALGAAELVLPGRISGLLGVRRHDALIRGFGLREIAAGLGLLATARATPWLWARVAGDALDLAALAAARRQTRRPSSVDAALAGVAAVTALDVAAAARRTPTSRPS